jgi:UDP-glucuronate decarboxylase
MKLLVSGAAGFLGSHLCRALLNYGHEVVGLDNYYTGNKRNLDNVVNFPKFKMLEQDVTTKIDGEYEGIFNLACPASPVHYQRNPIETVRTNVLGSLNLLDIAHSQKIPILQASTSEVYGDPEISPQIETYWGNVNPIGIRSCYDEGKRAAETLFFDYHRQNKVEIKVARIFNTYGPNMMRNDGRVVSNFIIQALEGEDLTIYGSGSQTRSFCFVSDLIEGLIKLFESEKGITGPTNLGNPVPTTMIELASKIISMTSSSSGIRHLPLPQDDPQHRMPDITKAEQELGWNPKVSLDEGLIKTIEYFANN